MTDRIDYRDAITSENLVLVTSCVHKTKMHTQEKCVSVKRYSISTIQPTLGSVIPHPSSTDRTMPRRNSTEIVTNYNLLDLIHTVSHNKVRMKGFKHRTAAASDKNNTRGLETK